MSVHTRHVVIGDSTVRLLVPSRREDKQVLALSLIESQKAHCEAVFTKLFGGTAPESLPLIGNYRHDDGSVTREEIRVVEATVSKSKLADQAARAEVIGLASDVCHQMDQECVFVAWGAEGILVSDQRPGRHAAIVRFRELPVGPQTKMMCFCWMGISSPTQLHQILSLDAWRPAKTHDEESECGLLLDHPVADSALGRVWLEPGAKYRWKSGVLRDGDLLVSESANGVALRLWFNGRVHGPAALHYSYSGPNPRTARFLRAILLDDVKELCDLLDQKDVRRGFFNDYSELVTQAEAQIRSQRTFRGREFGHAQLLLGRLMFLKFIEQKGWLANDLHFLNGLYTNRRGNFYKTELVPLFFDVLNRERKERRPEDLPFINGGLFQPRSGEADIRFSDEFFRKVLDVFDQYQFTMSEAPGTDEAVSVDPSMFGKVLESLADPEHTKKSGIHYTPSPIAHALAFESITARLADLAGVVPETMRRFCGGAIDELSPPEARRLNELLPELRIVDPAVGSGALLLACLEVLTTIAEHCHERMEIELHRGGYAWGCLSRRLVCGCLHGVDISEEAVEIAKLRLWLAVAVGDTAPTPLPDLEFNVRTADSLLEDRSIVETVVDGQQRLPLEDRDRLQNDYISAVEHYQAAGIDDPVAQHRLLVQLEEAQRAYQAGLGAIPARSGKRGKKHSTKGSGTDGTTVPFAWKLHYAPIFRGGRAGFDIVIANPPYVRIQSFNKSLKDPYKARWAVLREKSADLYYAFIELALELSAPGGQIAYIMPNFSRSGAGASLRNLLANEATIRLWVDFDDTQVFPSASNYVALLFAERNPSQDSSFPCVCVRDRSWVEQPTAEWLHQPDPDESRTGCASYLDEKWLTIPGRERRLLEPMLAPGVPLGTLVEICVGVQTSADKIFLFEEWREAGSGLVEVRSRALKRRVKLEANMLRTCIKGSRDKSDAGQPILLLWPYGKDETLMTPEQLGQTAGHVWSYLKACETKLRSREKGRFNDDQWYRFGRDQGIRQCGMPKVILPAILRTGTATVDEGGELTYTASGEGGGGAWGLLPRNRELDMQALAEFLRSDVVWRYFKALGFPQRGGWRGVDKSVLDPLPVPRELVPTDL